MPDASGTYRSEKVLIETKMKRKLLKTVTLFITAGTRQTNTKQRKKRVNMRATALQR